VFARRDGLPDLAMHPTPGFDPLMPHDMLHFLVEQELGLRPAIFGRIARGGPAGTLHPAEGDKSSTRAFSRHRRRNVRRGKKLLEENLDECAQSECAALYCLHDWLSHSPDEPLRARSAGMKINLTARRRRCPKPNGVNWPKRSEPTLENGWMNWARDGRRRRSINR
jgi:hypothetical protein